jgi:hypothetical protein
LKIYLNYPKEENVDHAIELTIKDALISFVLYRHFLLANNELETKLKTSFKMGISNP